MTMVLILILLPITTVISDYLINLLFKNKEAIIMIQESMREPVVDDIMDEVKMYDAIIEPIEEEKPIKPKREFKATVHKTKGLETELRNNMLKGVAVICLSTLTAWWKLASPILYVPAIVLTLCGMSYKVGEWKGQTK